MNADINKAIDVLDYAITHFPDDANIYDSKGEMLEEMGKKKEAKKYYQKALNKLEEMKDNYSEDEYKFYAKVFKENIERMGGK